MDLLTLGLMNKIKNSSGDNGNGGSSSGESSEDTI